LRRHDADLMLDIVGSDIRHVVGIVHMTFSVIMRTDPPPEAQYRPTTQP
jgi:hypothetical protein